MFKGFILILGLVSLVTACGPRDVPVNRDGATVGQQSIIVLEDEGERPSTCPAKFTDSVDLASPEENDLGIVSGSVYAALGAGDRNCFRIGSIVNIRNKSKDNPEAPVRARVKVTKVEIIPVEKLSKSQAKALGMSLGEVKDFADTELELATKTFNPKGMVNITYFDFVSKDGIVEPPPTKPVALYYDKDGDRPSTCPMKFADETHLVNPEAKDSQIFNGTVTASFNAGDRNCFRVGTIVDLQNKTKELPDAPIRGKLRVVRIEILPLEKIDAIQAKAMGLSMSDLSTYIQWEIETAMKTFNPKGMGSFTYFEYIPGQVSAL